MVPRDERAATPPGEGAEVSVTVAATPADRTSGAVSWRRDVQGLRGVAVLLVVLYHADVLFPGGFVGVDAFFVISGFVITGKLVRERDRTGRIDVGGFYAGRVRRLLPALALTVSVVALASVVLLSPLGARQETTATGVAASLFVANYQLAHEPAGYFDVDADANALLHTWSLSVEEQVYLVFPALLLLVWGITALGRTSAVGRTTTTLGRTTTVVGRATNDSRTSDRRTTAVGSGDVLLAVVALVAMASFVYAVVLVGSDERLAFYSSPARLWEFLAGGLVALVAPRLSTRRGPGAARVLLLTGAVLLLAAAVGYGETTTFPGLAAAVPVVGTVLMIVAGGLGGGRRSLLESRALVTLGDLSYSWYLWHWPCIVFARALFPQEGVAAPVAAVLALFPAWYSYRLVERPFRHRADLRGRRAVALAVPLILVPVAVCVLAGPLHRLVAPADTRQMVDQLARHAGSLRGCDSLEPVAARPAACTWSVDDPRGRVVLVGDSNAGHFVEGLAFAVNHLGYDLVVAMSSSCPFVAVRVERAGAEDRPGCRTFVRDTMADFEQDPPSAVVMAASVSRYLETPDIRLVTPEDGTVAATPAERAALWTRTTRAGLGRLTAAGSKVVVMAMVPHLGDWDPRACPVLRAQFAPARCTTEAPLAVLDAHRRRAVEADVAAGAGLDGVAVVDVADEVCPGGWCRARTDERWVYRDGGHLTVPASEALAPTLRAALAPLLAG